MNKTEVLTKTITDLQQALNKAQRELEEAKKEKVWPLINENYFFTDSVGKVIMTDWVDGNTDLSRKTIGNIFRTKEEAEHYRDYLKSHVQQARYKLQKYADECNKGWVYKGNGEKGYHCYVEQGKVFVNYYSTSRLPVVTFKNKEDALKAIELLGEDVVKLACGVVE